MARPKKVVQRTVKVNANVRSVTPTDKIIGTRLRARRLEMHVTQDELATKLGLSFQQVQKYEKGMNRIGTSRLMQIATALECDSSYFLPAGTNGGTKQSRFVEFLATADGVKINEAMMKLGEPHRRGVIELAETLARAYGE